MERLIVGDIVKHFKRELTKNPGDMYLYKIIAISNNLDNGERFVIYQALYGDNIVLHREYNNFMSTVDHIKYPNVKQEYRFEKYTDIETITVEMNIDIMGNKDKLLKALNHHIEYLIDLDNWPEIKGIHGVRIRRTR
ncbi:MAG: DUF1653 domain-containing protein [Lachnospiraceae bacterium]|nr:DUF1653 domain-containing protein [Lachnospiraceae bacterium]